GPVDQPWYCNAVVRVCGELGSPSASSALCLLDALQALEGQFGRNRAAEVRWGPRSLDLDLLFWDELRLDHPRLLLPHPRLHLRRFTLMPMGDVVPNWSHPTLGRSLTTLLDECPDEVVPTIVV
ncbi:MAG: 2-amino-4-hydroxy-6-hydroxymethyldihydropteridine diphosphokinase, partial [Flavobacteriia bacterium]|nr:2-amino-4-hydroxy-6-hydroxymethyldihydropteridine diphosphokinase [Flavobacteriia bacterium]